ncbi:TIGR02147 family protein [Bdellovibrio sp. KM01]|uniref:TIGR02147 family protein n=1 Tax=Bdellovibrio sp. KM01 TaxID=2748865 RepID=UPI0015EA5385|nr:TIGR02147 family protein [Bdellovibrio sp. KM01]QLY24030.1 TIGR02147 family protein [Bdellovibrio sp. KM01]
MGNTSIKKTSELSNFFNEIFLNRRRKNPKYSMRAFARDLSLTQGRLWELIHGRYIPGAKVTERISELLKLSPEDKSKMQMLIAAEKAQPVSTMRSVSNDEFAMISDWEHLAIFNLISTKGFDHTINSIVSRLEISQLQAEGALNRLVDQGLVTEEDGRYVPAYTNITTQNEVPSEVLREFHRQIIGRSVTSLQRDSVDSRSITSMVFPANVKNLAKAKKIIAEFNVRMAELMDKGDTTEVYSLAVQLVPITVAGR